MSRPQRWFLAALLGAVAVVTTAIALIAALLFLVLTIPVVRPDVPVGASGLLSGFGGLWLALMAAQAAAGGMLPDAGFWVAVGAVPLAIGLGLAVLLAVAPGSGRRATGA